MLGARRSRRGGKEDSRQPTEGERAQPRPALGRRPWFALRRRARSLRRFAFAMVDGRVPGGGRNQLRQVTLVSPRWRRSAVVVAAGTTARWRGLRPAPSGRALLVKGSSVHGFGMREPLWVAALDRSGCVIDTNVLLPGRILLERRAAWLLELPVIEDPPPVGARLRVLPSSRP